MSKHKLLKEDILPAMASNRKVQRLLNEFMDLLSEYQFTETTLIQKNPPSAAHLPSEGKTGPDPPLDERISHSIPTKKQKIISDSTTVPVTQTNPSPVTTDQTENAITPIPNQTGSAPGQEDQVQKGTQISEPMNLDPPATDHSSTAGSQAKENAS